MTDGERQDQGSKPELLRVSSLRALRVLQGALALREFTVEEMSRYISMDPKSIQRVVSRRGEVFEKVGSRTTDGPGRPRVVYSLREDQVALAVKSVDDLRATLVAGSSDDNDTSSQDQARNVGIAEVPAGFYAAEYQLARVESGQLDETQLMAALSSAASGLRAATLDIEDLELMGGGGTDSLRARLSTYRDSLEAARAVLLPTVVEAKEEEGIVVCSDIVGFTELQPQKQLEAMVLLISTCKSSWLRGVETQCDFVSDGVIIAVRASRGAFFKEALDFAKLLIDGMAEAASVRVSVHYGSYQYFCGVGLERLFGAAVSQCGRLSSFADAGDCVVSEEFLSMWSSATGLSDVGEGRLFPSDRPFEVMVKPTELQSFRVLSRSPRAPLPQRVRGLVEADDALLKTLQLVEEEFIENVRLRLHVSELELATRVSIFAPYDGFLRCTSYRCEAGRNARRSSTAYPLDERGGVFWLAYSGRRPLVVRGLAQEQECYERDIERKAGIGPAISRKFSRNARAFLVIPIAMQHAMPDAVMCVDTLNDLSGLRSDYLKRLASGIQSRYASELAAYWRLRVLKAQSDIPLDVEGPASGVAPTTATVIRSFDATQRQLFLEGGWRAADTLTYAGDLDRNEFRSVKLDLGTIFISSPAQEPT